MDQIKYRPRDGWDPTLRYVTPTESWFGWGCRTVLWVICWVVFSEAPLLGQLAGPVLASDRFARVTDAAQAAPSQGQIWKAYDLRSYVDRMQGTEAPMQQVVDWVLRETGTDRWLGLTPGMLSVEGAKLRVYHLPEVHLIVEDIVERFANPNLAGNAVSAHLVTVESVNWRSVAMPLMQPIAVQTAGVEAWVMSRENASLLMAHLRQRVDYREQNSSAIQIRHGQAHAIERWMPRNYPQSVRLSPGSFPGYQVQSGQVRSGYTLKIAPLAERAAVRGRPASGGGWMQAVVQVQIDQIEKLSSLWQDVPAVAGQPKRVEVQVPQVSSWRVQERFRWPRDQVLLVSRGMVGLAGVGGESKSFRLGRRPDRVDALLMLECIDVAERSESAVEAKQAARLNYHDRY